MKLIPVAFAALLAMPAPAQEEAPAPKDQDTRRLTAIGGLSASALYFGFVNIGLTGDGFEKGVYDADTASAVAGEIKRMLAINAKQLKAMKDGEPDENDRTSVAEIIDLAGAVGDYADLFVEYTKEKDPKVAEKFQTQRKALWERLKKFMGLK